MAIASMLCVAIDGGLTGIYKRESTGVLRGSRMAVTMVTSAGFSKFAPSLSSVLLSTTTSVVSAAMVAPSPAISFAQRAKSQKTSPDPSPPPIPTTNGSAPNVWAARKEQMAARASSTAASSSSSPVIPPSSLPPRRSNGVALNDPAHWPQVAVAAVATPTKDTKEKEKAQLPPRAEQPVPTPASTPKKNEKTKWVPIPPTELQAAADAVLRQQPRSSGRSSPRHASAATSTHSSPKANTRGRRLPPDEQPSTTNPTTPRRSPSRLAKHAYTHPYDSPTRPPASFPAPLTNHNHLPPHSHALPEPHHPPLTRQKRPAPPQTSEPVAGYRDMDDLKVGEGRRVMFGSIGTQSPDALPAADAADEQRRREQDWEKRVKGKAGLAIGVGEEDVKVLKKGKGEGQLVVVKPEVVDLTDDAWLKD
ncbi:hypothetical protein M422DRAFT_258267, partial [Sphaerobolus stellatus SS14]